MESIEKACCVVTVSKSKLSNHRPISCSGLILNYQSGVALCSGLLFSRYVNDQTPLSADCSFLLPDSFSDNLKICVNFSAQRNLDTNQCAHEVYTAPSSTATHQHQVTAQLLMLVNCLEFKKRLSQIFREADKWSFYGGLEDEESHRESQFLSWFAVLKIPSLSGASHTGTIPWIKSSFLQKGCTVMACGSPFGSLCPDLFMSTLSKGIVSNLAGEDNTVILTDARCLPGTEGGGLFVTQGNRSYVVGVIVSPLCWKASEWIGLTLVCSFQELLKNIRWCVNIQDPMCDTSLDCETAVFLDLPITPTSATQNYPMVTLVDSGQFWGSGVLVSAQLVLTCRHVVNAKSVVTVKFYDRDRFHDVLGDVLFSTKSSSPYDVAVIQLRDLYHEADNSRLATSFCPGENVVVVGFGALGQACGPSLTSGILSKAVSWGSQPVMLQTTCAVQAGSSGGAVVSAHSGELLGLVSSNTRDFAAKVTYPHLNFSVPMSVIQPLLERFNQTGDADVFTALDSTEEGVRRVWRLQGGQSKL
ncbi:peroxisomal leader peptide-processing protease [Aplochiton taeniatus]